MSCCRSSCMASRCISRRPFPRVIEEIFRDHRALVIPVGALDLAGLASRWILKGAPVSLAVSAGAPLSLDLENEVFAAAPA